jgi:hypothetical protein
LKKVVMAAMSALIPWTFARYDHLRDGPFLGQPANGPVDSGNAEPGHAALGFAMNFLRRQGVAGTLPGLICPQEIF